MINEVNKILRERGILKDDARIAELSLGPKAESAEQIANAIQASIEEIQAGGDRDIDLDD